MTDHPVTPSPAEAAANLQKHADFIRRAGASGVMVDLVDLDVAIAALAERDNALAEVARLRRELDEAWALASTCSCGTSPMTYEGPEPDCAVHGAVRAFNQAVVELAQLRGDFDNLTVRFYDEVRYREAVQAERDALAARLERAEAERDAMRAVVEAAAAWRVEIRDDPASHRRQWALIVEVDTYRAATPSTPEPAP